MATDSASSPLLRRWGWLICLLGGAFMALAYLPYDYGNIVWLGLLPLLCVLWGQELRFWQAFRKGWCYGMGWYCVSFWWIHEVGYVFGIPMPVFMAVAFLPLMAVYSLLPAFWAGIMATLLRPTLLPLPDTAGMKPDAARAARRAWAFADMRSTLRAAVGGGALWVVIEWLRAHGTLGFSWNSLGMALYDGLSMVQWAEFVGTAALSFIPVTTGIILWCAVRRGWLQFRAVGHGVSPWDFYGCVVVLFGLFLGGLALSKAYAPQVMMRRDSVLQLPVLAIQENLDQQERIEEGSFRPYMYGVYLRSTMAAFNEIQRDTVRRAMQREDVGLTQQLPVWVVWPESALGAPIHRNTATGKLREDDRLTTEQFFGDEGLPMLREKVQEIGGQPFVLFTGADEWLWEPDSSQPGGFRPGGLLNSLAVMPGGFDSITTASKQHLMPFGEYIPLANSVDFIAKAYADITGTQVGEGLHEGTGDEPLMVPVPGTDESVGVIPAVCYEDTVGDLLTKFVRKGPQVIVNDTNDAWFRFSACGEQQARNAAFRCIELRRPMVRSANMGVTCAIAPNGAFIHALRKGDGDPHTPGYSYAVLPVDREAGFTLYALFGDWAVGLCAMLAVGLMRRKRR